MLHRTLWITVLTTLMLFWQNGDIVNVRLYDNQSDYCGEHPIIYIGQATLLSIDDSVWLLPDVTLMAKHEKIELDNETWNWTEGISQYSLKEGETYKLAYYGQCYQYKDNAWTIDYSWIMILR